METICGLAHFGLYVSDMEVSKKFYTDILGFQFAFETNQEGGPHLCFLRNGNCEIELIARSGAELSDGHFDHLCLRVTDIEAAVAHLAVHGIPTEFPIREMPQVYQGIKMVMFRGPDGEHLEFNEFC